MFRAYYEFYYAQVKNVLPREFWETHNFLSGSKENMLLDMYGKTEDDDFTVKDMIEIMINEYPKYVSGLLADKTVHTLNLLSYSPLYSDYDFFKLDLSNCFPYLAQIMHKQGKKDRGYFQFYGADGLHGFVDSVEEFIRNECGEYNYNDFPMRIIRAGDAINTLNVSQNLIKKARWSDTEKTDIELSYLSKRALIFLHDILIMPYFVIFNKKLPIDN